jgi:4-amino-4-deoxy-L-arabinose transferase-like glycosyltransferase
MLTPDRRIIFALFSIAFGVRILYAVLIGTDPEIITNPITYDFAKGREIAEGANWWSQPLSPRAPGYQLLLGALFSVGGIHQWLAIIVQSFFGGVIAFMLYRIGEKSLGAWVGLASAIWFAVYVHQAHFTSILARDVTVGMLVVFVCYLLFRYSRTMRGALGTASVYALLVHFDPQYLLFLPVLVLYYLLSAGRHQLMRVQHTFLFLGTVLVLLAPWTIRNYRVYGDPIPVALEATKYLPHADFTPGGTDHKAGNGVSRPGFWRNSVEYWRVMRLREGVQTMPDGAERVLSPWSVRHNAVSLVTYGVLLPFFLAGLWISVRSRNRAGVVLAVAVAGMYLLRAFYGGTPRARLPAEPLIILLAFHAAVGLYGKCRAKRSPVEDVGEKVPSA